MYDIYFINSSCRIIDFVWGLIPDLPYPCQITGIRRSKAPCFIKTQLVLVGKQTSENIPFTSKLILKIKKREFSLKYIKYLSINTASVLVYFPIEKWNKETNLNILRKIDESYYI